MIVTVCYILYTTLHTCGYTLYRLFVNCVVTTRSTIGEDTAAGNGHDNDDPIHDHDYDYDSSATTTTATTTTTAILLCLLLLLPRRRLLQLLLLLLLLAAPRTWIALSVELPSAQLQQISSQISSHVHVN